MDESEIQQIIQMEAVKFGVTLMRNNSGALKDSTGRVVRFGLGNVSKVHSDKIKSSDLIGFKTVTITPEMVGQRIAVFSAIECKHPDWNPDKKLDQRELAQLNFIQWVLAKGGIAGFANDVSSMERILK